MVMGIIDEDSEEQSAREPAAPISYQPQSTEETTRQSGLAWSAGIVFFSSIAFMLFLGWLADLLLGSSPWGIVVGIVLGSIIGFVQFFRLSSQIFNAKKRNSELRPLVPDRGFRHCCQDSSGPPKPSFRL